MLVIVKIQVINLKKDILISTIIAGCEPRLVTDVSIDEFFNVLKLQDTSVVTTDISDISGTYKDVEYEYDIYETNSSNKDTAYLLPVSVRLGRNISNHFFYNTYKTRKHHLNKGLHNWRNDVWKAKNEDLYNSIYNDDTLVSEVGVKLIEILRENYFLDYTLKISSRVSQVHELVIVEKDLLKGLDKSELYTLPNHLPMLVPTKDYTKYGDLGRYLTNDELTSNDMFIDKKGYKISSKVSEGENMVYNLVNNISKIPFKINTELLDFVLYKKNDRFNLLIDTDVKHEFAHIKRNKIQDNKSKAHNSKILLQESILQIANFFRTFSKIYFPVRLCQRGRLYCTPNYQGNKLCKALILFARPGTILRDENDNGIDGSGISYMKCYGANSYGGKIAKKSIKDKENWVNDNEYDIVNYDKSDILLGAKDKLLFLAFCMEYKRYYYIIQSEESRKFMSYLPIQLDASCNGLQHIALLSGEKELYEVLNLTESKDKDPSIPNDFYSYLLTKVLQYFKDVLSDPKVDLSPEDRDSYNRIVDLPCIRAIINKAVMTIPYNASIGSVYKYIRSDLIPVRSEDVIDNKGNTKFLRWYQTPENQGDNSKLINTRDTLILSQKLNSLIFNEHERIKTLTEYLGSVTKLYNKLNLSIIWNLPTGLRVIQSYMKSSTTPISPFQYSKVKLNIKTRSSTQYNSRKQTRALMPNIIHYLDASSLCLFFKKFNENNYLGDSHIMCEERDQTHHDLLNLWYVNYHIIYHYHMIQILLNLIIPKRKAVLLILIELKGKPIISRKITL